MNTYSNKLYIGIGFPKEKADVMLKLPRKGMEKENQAITMLKTAFQAFKNGFSHRIAIICHNSEEENIFRKYFWNESLELLGNSSIMDEFKQQIAKFNDNSDLTSLQSNYKGWFDFFNLDTIDSVSAARNALA